LLKADTIKYELVALKIEPEVSESIGYWYIKTPPYTMFNSKDKLPEPYFITTQQSLTNLERMEASVWVVHPRI